MINRHLLRIKVLQITYAFYTKECSTDNILKELSSSLEMTRMLYAKVLGLAIEFYNISERKLALQEDQTVLSEDVSKKMQRIAGNRFFKMLSEDEHLRDFFKAKKVSWQLQDDFVLNIYNDFIASELVEVYFQKEDTLSEDKKFAEKFFVNYLANSELFFEELEIQNLYWNDDFVFVLPSLQRAVKQTREDSVEVFLPNLYKNKEDKLFAESLLLKVIRLEDKNKILIESATPNWEYERITLIDRLLMSLAITEMMEFETIPVKVSLNEYVEISKYYSTENSSVFINGILDKIAKKEDVQSLKKGIGLL